MLWSGAWWQQITRVLYFRQLPLISESEVNEILDVRSYFSFMLRLHQFNFRFCVNAWTTKLWKCGRWLGRKPWIWLYSPTLLTLVQHLVGHTSTISEAQRRDFEGVVNFYSGLSVLPILWSRIDSSNWRERFSSPVVNRRFTTLLSASDMLLSLVYVPSSTVSRIPSRNGCRGSWQQWCWNMYMILWATLICLSFLLIPFAADSDLDNYP